MSWDQSDISVGEDGQVLKRCVTSPLKYYRIELHLMFRVCTTAFGAVEHMFFQSRVLSQVEEKKSSLWMLGVDSAFWTEICLVSCDTLSFCSQSIGRFLTKLSSLRLRKKSNRLQVIKFRTGSECPSLKKLAKSLIYHLLQHADLASKTTAKKHGIQGFLSKSASFMSLRAPNL